MLVEQKIDAEINRFTPITLDKMEAVRMDKRMDTKFVFPLSKLPGLLLQVKDMYYIVEICNQLKQSYETIYLDTPDYAMYKLHHNGKLNRHKIRIRKYLNSKQQFLEIKMKNNKGETIKQRVDCQFIGDSSGAYVQEDALSKEFVALHSPYESHMIEPVLLTSFVRLTLVCKDYTERVTIDYNLAYNSMQNTLKKQVEDICIGEIKREKNTLTDSLFMKVCRKEKIFPMRYSKYCMGMVMLNTGVKQNLFKGKFRCIEKLI